MVREPACSLLRSRGATGVALSGAALRVRTKQSICCKIRRKGDMRRCAGARGVSGDQKEAADAPSGNGIDE
jgi:hypothetical protein